MTQQANGLSNPDQQIFTEFYDTYAPRLWGIILLANLPTPQSETILTNTFTKAWRQIRQKPPTKLNVTWLLSLAYSEGLPRKAVREILLSKI